MAALRVGLVGAGSMGSLHARVVAEHPDTELAWVADPSEEVGGEVANRFGSRWTPEPEPDSADAVIVAAATEAHHPLAVDLIASGVPLLVEKPLADSLEHSRDIVDRSAAAGVPLLCGFLERYNPAIRTAMEFVEAPVHVAAIRHSPYVPRIRTGVASDLLIHDLDTLIRMFGGAPEAVSGSLGCFHPSSAPGAEDVAEATLRFASGAVGTASASRLSQRKLRSLVIHEVDRQIELDLVRSDITVYRHVGNAPFDADSGLGYSQQTVIDIPVIRHQREPLASQLDLFVELVRGTEDADRVRDSLLPAHELLERVRDHAGFRPAG